MHRLDAQSRATGQKRGSEAAGPSPVNRGKQGTKRHYLTDANGIILNVVLSGANVNDDKLLEEVLDTAPGVSGHRRGRPRFRPGKLHGDKAYDIKACLAALKRRRIVSRIARRGVDSSQRLGRRRWVIERSISWSNGSRRLKVRYEQQPEMYLAFCWLGAALVNLRFLPAKSNC